MSVGRSRPEPSRPHQLLVEGKDDVHAIGALLQRHGLDASREPWMAYIRDENGIESLLDALPVALKTTYSRLGVVVDADTEVVGRWSEVRNRFSQAGIELPAAPEAGGLVRDLEERGGPRRVGLWLMPNNEAKGNLEDFLSLLVPAEDAIWEKAKMCTEEAMRAGARLGESQRSKGEMYAYLAWQERPGMPFGTALTAKVLAHDAEVARRFVAWYRALFEAP